MHTRHYDDLTVERWRIEPRLPSSLALTETEDTVQSPPLWKDLTLASVIALGLWLAAAAVFG